MTVDVWEDWRTRAACTEVDPDLMHPAWRAEEIAAAKQVCAGCPVRAECLREAVRNGEDDGIWGGLTPTERRAYSVRLPRAERRKGGCPDCGRAISLAHGRLRDHNVSKDNGAAPCPGSGWVP